LIFSLTFIQQFWNHFVWKKAIGRFCQIEPEWLKLSRYKTWEEETPIVPRKSIQFNALILFFNVPKIKCIFHQFRGGINRPVLLLEPNIVLHRQEEFINKYFKQRDLMFGQNPHTYLVFVGQSFRKMWINIELEVSPMGSFRMGFDASRNPAGWDGRNGASTKHGQLHPKTTRYNIYIDPIAAVLGLARACPCWGTPLKTRQRFALYTFLSTKDHYPSNLVIYFNKNNGITGLFAILPMLIPFWTSSAMVELCCLCLYNPPQPRKSKKTNFEEK
jgi:hypothetical protein